MPTPLSPAAIPPEPHRPRNTLRHPPLDAAAPDAAEGEERRGVGDAAATESPEGVTVPEGA